MVRKGDDVVVLWPRYFNQRLSRAEGRRVPTSLAVKAPDAAWIASACKKAGLSCTLEEDAVDPAVPYKKVGRVVVDGRGSKEATIKKVANHMLGDSPTASKQA